MNKAETEDDEPLTQDEVNEIMSGNFYDKLSQVQFQRTYTTNICSSFL